MRLSAVLFSPQLIWYALRDNVEILRALVDFSGPKPESFALGNLPSIIKCNLLPSLPSESSADSNRPLSLSLFSLTGAEPTRANGTMLRRLSMDERSGTQASWASRSFTAPTPESSISCVRLPPFSPSRVRTDSASCVA